MSANKNNTPNPIRKLFSNTKARVEKKIKCNNKHVITVNEKMICRHMQKDTNQSKGWQQRTK